MHRGPILRLLIWKAPSRAAAMAGIAGSSTTKPMAGPTLALTAMSILGSVTQRRHSRDMASIKMDTVMDRPTTTRTIGGYAIIGIVSTIDACVVAADGTRGGLSR